MRSHLLVFFETRDPEALHHFRIQVKQMKAILFFLQPRSKDFYRVNLLQSLRSIYRHAGKIRSAYIHEGLLEQYSVESTDYKRTLAHIKKDEIRQFYAKRNAYSKTVQLISKALSKGFRDVEDKDIVKLYRKRLKKIARFFTQPILSPDKLHQVRKKIKNLLYLHRILPKRLADKLHLNGAYLDQLQEVIGKWHDVISVIELLKTGIVADGSLKTQLHREKRNLYRSIQVLSTEFEKKVLG